MHSPLFSNQVRDADVVDVGLGGIGVVVHDGADVVSGDRHGHFRAELLIDVIDADLAQLVRALGSSETDAANSNLVWKASSRPE